MVVCVCVCSVQESAVLAVVMNRIVFVLGSNDKYTRLGLHGGATVLRNADNPLTVETA